MKFTFRNASFSYTDRGKGTAIVMLHGFLENKEMWNNLADFLEDKYRIITLDLPGHGDSDCLGYVHNMEDMAGVTWALVKKLRLKKFHLLGHSMGGYVALALAEKQPDNLRSLILMNSTAKADSLSKKRDRDKAISLVKSNHKSFIRKSLPHLFRPKNRKIFKKEINSLKSSALNMPKRGVLAALEGMKVRNDREALLHLAPYPVLLIAGKRDPVLKWEDLQEQLKAPQVQSLISEHGHMSHIEDRELLFKGLAEFLKNH